MTIFKKDLIVNILMVVVVLLYDICLFFIAREFEYGIDARDEIVPGITRLFLDYKIILFLIPLFSLFPMFSNKLKNYREYVFWGVLSSVIVVSIISFTGFAAVKFVFPYQILDVSTEEQ